VELIDILRTNRGSATLEASVMFILILILIVGFVYLINAVTVYAVAQTAAREGAREYSMTDSSAKAVKKAKVELETGGVDSNRATITTNAAGQERRMTVTVNYPFYVPVVGERELALRCGASFRRVRYGR
jgi:Flp pilus assembly protein TadG